MLDEVQVNNLCWKTDSEPVECANIKQVKCFLPWGLCVTAIVKPWAWSSDFCLVTDVKVWSVFHRGITLKASRHRQKISFSLILIIQTNWRGSMRCLLFMKDKRRRKDPAHFSSHVVQHQVVNVKAVFSNIVMPRMSIFHPNGKCNCGSSPNTVFFVCWTAWQIYMIKKIHDSHSFKGEPNIFRKMEVGTGSIDSCGLESNLLRTYIYRKYAKIVHQKNLNGIWGGGMNFIISLPQHIQFGRVPH